MTETVQLLETSGYRFCDDHEDARVAVQSKVVGERCEKCLTVSRRNLLFEEKVRNETENMYCSLRQGETRQ